MKQLAQPIRLDKVFEPTTQERPLAVGDELVSVTGCRHAIFGWADDRSKACGVNITDKRIWRSGPQLVSNPDSLTEGEVRCLALSSWDNLSRIGPDGSDTPLSTIYAEPEKIDVGVGSFVQHQNGDIFTLISVDGRTRWFNLSDHIVRTYTIKTVEGRAPTKSQIEYLCLASLDRYTLLPRKTALAKLAEEE